MRVSTPRRGRARRSAAAGRRSARSSCAGSARRTGSGRCTGASGATSRLRARAPGASGLPCSSDLAREVAVQAGDAAGERGLARARLADERDALARLRPSGRCRTAPAARRARRSGSRTRQERRRRLGDLPPARAPPRSRTRGGEHLCVPDSSAPRGPSASSTAAGTTLWHVLVDPVRSAARRSSPSGRWPGRGACPGCPRSACSPHISGIASIRRRAYGCAGPGRTRASGRSRRSVPRT